MNGIREVLSARGISQVLHYTTNRGILGILAEGKCLAREQVSVSQRLEYIVKYGCPDRKRDRDWHNYVNLSITRINKRLFNVAENQWHLELKESGWWCVLVFDASILEHEGVYFATTNNMYTGVRRAKGKIGLEALFAPKIHQYLDSFANRRSEIHNETTCQQAEALYPRSISLEYLKYIAVRSGDHFDDIHGMSAALNIPPPICKIQPDIFEGQ